MKQMINSNFSFFKAGQGAFYGGKIWISEINKQFTIIYDCGTSNFSSRNRAILNHEIDFFRDSYCNDSKDIDILFISHLDYDHVSGIKRLLIEFNVKRIVLPYLPLHIRQFFLISISSGNDPDEDDLSINDYMRFIENPYSYIKEVSETTEIFIINGDQSPETDGYYVGYENNDSDDIYPKGDLWNKDIFPELTNLDCFLYSNNLQFFIQKKWEFTTYVQSVNAITLNSLIECINLKLKKDPTNSISIDDLKDFLTKNRKKAWDCYKKHLGDVNSHGLVLLHGPLNYSFIDVHYHIDDSLGISCNSISCCNDFFEHNSFRRTRLPFLSTLLMGDVSITPSTLPPKFADKLDKVHVFQIPHHGSSKNWSLRDYRKIVRRTNRRFKPINVCNFGYGNTYGHPGHQVLSDLKGKVVLNSQFLRFSIRYYIHYR